MSNITLDVITRSNRINTHLKYLKHLYANIETVGENPNFKNCINISFSDAADLNNETTIEICLHTFAGKLEFDNKIAIKMARNNNQLFVITKVI